MKVSEILTWKNTKLAAGINKLDNSINGGYTSDLLSDVMGNADENMAWITMQTHKNVIAIASLKELACVIIVNGNKPADDTIDAANSENIPVIVTQYSAFELSGLLYCTLNQ